MGVLFGATVNVSRVVILSLVPPERRVEHFGVYAGLERISAIMAPIVWSTPLLLISDKEMEYRLAMGLIAVLVICGAGGCAESLSEKDGERDKVGGV